MAHSDEIARLLNVYVDTLVSELTTKLMDAENARAQLAAAVEVKSNQIADLTTQVARREDEIATLKTRITELENPVTPPTDPADLFYWGTPVWRDEFTGGLDKWNVRTQANFGLGIDAGIPEAANVTVSNGLLHIKGEWLPDAPRSRSASATGVTVLTHTTGYIDLRPLKTGDKTFSQTYGRWEIRCKTPTGPNTRGSLAAFWLRPNDRSGEIDIMEAWGYGGTMATDHTKYLKDTAVTTIHTKTDGSGTKKFWRHKEHGGPANVWQDFHVYAFEYTPDYAATFVDGVQIMRVTPSADGGTGLWNAAYFGSPMHVRLNMHIGPSVAYWGLPDPANKAYTQNLDYQVDYVRIYALPA
jgi:beta-glucanase (GH16 family)